MMSRLHKYPETLAKISLKNVVSLVISCLDRFELLKDGSRNNGSKEECLYLGKMKRPREEVDDSVDLPRKRMRRNSYDSSKSQFHTFTDFNLSSKDDNFISKSTLVDSVIILKNYFKYLPQNLWNMLFHSVIKVLNGNQEFINSSLEKNSFELLFSRKVSFFSTKLMTIDIFRKCEKFICERIHVCKNLGCLHIVHNISPQNLNLFLLSLNKLQNLTSVILLPEEKQSFHGAIPVLANYANLLRELQIVYNCNLLSNCGIEILASSKNLKTLLLFSYGVGSEAEHIEKLLINLNDLQSFFHRELPNVIVDIFRKNKLREFSTNDGPFKLKTLILATYCKSVGTLLCYFPDESIADIGRICPHITELKIIRPSNLLKIVNSMRSLTNLEIHDCNVLELFLPTTSESNVLENISLLCLHNIDYLDYKSIVLISNSCSSLEYLEITNCNLYASNDLLSAKKPLFPHLKKLNIQRSPRIEQTIPIFVYPHVMNINKCLFKHFLTKVPKLQYLYLDFGTDYVEGRDPLSIPDEEDLIHFISQCRDLKELMLIACPRITYNMMSVIISSCPKLNRLWNVDLWEIPPNEMDKIYRNYSYLFFHTYNG